MTWKMMSCPFEYFIGIDPGLTGAITALRADGMPHMCWEFPCLEETKKARPGMKSATRIERRPAYEELRAIFLAIRQHCQPCVVYLEQVSARPGEGVCASFKFGEIYGALKFALHAFKLPYREVHPSEWCNAMHLPGDKEKKAKKRSLNAYTRLFHGKLPTVKPSTGLVDSALIAEYARRGQLNGIEGARRHQRRLF